MNSLARSLAGSMICIVSITSAVSLATSRLALTQEPAAITKPEAVPDNSHGFDYEAGSWKIHLKKRLNPLTGSNTWVEFDGTSVTRRLWDGRGSIEEFETDGPSGHIEGLTLRTYNPTTHLWSIYWANAAQGYLGMPAMVGYFKDGRGEFYDQEDYNGRMIFVRFLWTDITPTSAHFEQSFSTDAGKTWEVNWITDQTRVKP